MAKRRAAGPAKNGKKAAPEGQAETYRHPTATSPLRPDVGTQAQFKKRKAPKTYRYDSSLSPEMEWDGKNYARDLGEWLLARIEEAAALSAPHEFPKPREFKATNGKAVATVRGLLDAVAQLKQLEKPFLNWAGKAERLSFDVPTLPLFVHERLSTQAILETLQSHKKDQQQTMFDLWGDPQHSIADQVLRAYEYQDKWVNRMILGNSLVVMNSLLEYENLGEQVQMIYIDPPYGVKFGSNFQPFVRNRNVTHNDDDDFTREPEMVQAYRDTWELGLHSYLTYMRDQLLLARDLLAPTGSIFVQINDENVHHVREIMDEVFGAENFLVSIFMRKKGSQRGNEIRPINDHILWYAKDRSRIKRRYLYDSKMDAYDLADEFDYVEMPDKSTRHIASFEPEELQESMRSGARLYIPEPLTSGGEFGTQLYTVDYDGKKFRPPPGNSWKFNEEGMRRIIASGRLHVGKTQIRFKKYHTDFPFRALNNLWADLAGATDKVYVVQTATKAIQRCMLMTTDPGDLVLDPTCGSGSTAYVAEQWGRRWLTIDVSRVPLALAKQRLLSATFSWYQLNDDAHGPAAGFAYKRKQNNKGDDTGGVVPHITSTSIANDELATEEVLVDRPEEIKGITRVAGPFAFEATIPTPVDFDEESDTGTAISEEHGSFVERMLEVLRRSPLLHLGKETVALTHLRPPAKALSINAEAVVDATAPGQKPTLDEAVQESLEKSGKALPLSQKLVALVFGPENAAVSEKLVFEAAKEALAKDYTHLYVIGFAIQANARELIDKCNSVVGIPATYVQATPDILMGDLLKNMRSSQIFSVCGLPEVELRKLKGKAGTRYEVELLGLDTFDPATMTADHKTGQDVPAWFLDTDYNGLCFHVSQAFFPRTGAWENLKKALKGHYEDSVWEHLAGTVSAPFEGGEHGQIAVKVIDMRGNELLVVKNLKEAGA